MMPKMEFVVKLKRCFNFRYGYEAEIAGEDPPEMRGWGRNGEEECRYRVPVPAPQGSGMKTCEGLQDLIEDIYGTVARPVSWRNVLARVVALCDADAGGLLLQPRKHGAQPVIEAVGWPPAAVSTYLRDYVDRSVWLQRACDKGIGSALILSRIEDRTLLEESAYYRDFLCPNGVQDVCGVVLDIDPQASPSASWIAVNRRDAHEPFGDVQAAIMEKLAPHFRRSILLHREMLDVVSIGRKVNDALDLFSAGVVIAGSDARPRVINRRAAAILERRDGLRLHDGAIAATNPRTTSALQKTIARAAMGGGGGYAPADGAILVPRERSDAPSYSVVVMPLHALDIHGFSNAASDMPAAALFIVDPADLPLPRDAFLMRLYGLTPAEARLVRGLVAGDRIADLAPRLGVSRNTLRSQLQQVFGKTGVHRQAELVRMILTGPATLVAVEPRDTAAGYDPEGSDVRQDRGSAAANGQ